MVKKNDIVTVDFENNSSSNTYVIFDKIGEDKYLLYHPVYPDVFVIKSFKHLNKSASNIKDSTERSLDFALCHKSHLDYNTKLDLESLCLFFSIKRQFTPKQKHLLASICGNIAAIQFNNNIKSAMDHIVQNEGALDEFNQMWYHNFKGLFTGNQPITSKKQRSAIFNMAGFLLAEMKNPVVEKI